ncbi:uncharacterized protein LOC121761737 [Salvia splendens]|uniref:uncharacterized protein LOC121761737 n=1 Tax=Salvia splendens TaxID=180675 RepID=UPI001C25382A|nr:uncharacterized protein LOC121761737 [Salvia splendens]
MEMKNDEDSSSEQRVVYEYDFFNENRTCPIRSHILPIERESTPAEMKKQRVVYEYDFFDENRTGPIRSFLVPIEREATPADMFEVFEKTLEAMDLSNTLFVREIERVMWFLREKERKKLERGGFLEVPTIDPSGNVYKMQLKQSPIFIGVAEMSGEWAKLVGDNKLKKGDWVYGWGYRRDGHFCIAINYLRFKASCDCNKSLLLPFSCF